MFIDSRSDFWGLRPSNATFGSQASILPIDPADKQASKSPNIRPKSSGKLPILTLQTNPQSNKQRCEAIYQRWARQLWDWKVYTCLCVFLGELFMFRLTKRAALSGSFVIFDSSCLKQVVVDCMLEYTWSLHLFFLGVLDESHATDSKHMIILYIGNITRADSSQSDNPSSSRT